MCGILAVIGNKLNAVLPKYFRALVDEVKISALDLQHRGPNGCGIAWCGDDNGVMNLRVEKGLSLVESTLTAALMEEISRDRPLGIIVHTRYPTSGSISQKNTQPHYVESVFGRFVLCSNGDIPKNSYQENRNFLESKGVIFLSDNDGELILRMIVYFSQGKQDKILPAIKEVMHRIKGAYSSLLLTKYGLYAFRDPRGVRPMTLVKNNGYVMIASESCAWEDYCNIADQDKTDINPGSVVYVDYYQRIKVQQLVRSNILRHCVFENIYISRPDSQIFGSPQEVATFRYYLGKQWVSEVHQLLSKKQWQQFIDRYQFISGVPESGNFSAMGVAAALEELTGRSRMKAAIVKNAYISRTFINEADNKQRLASAKYRPLGDIYKKYTGEIICDDSIVRGTTTRALISKIRKKGARFIAFAVSSPPLIDICQLGINIASKRELIAGHLAVEDIRKFLDVDYLHYLSLSGLKTTLRKVGLNPNDFCYGCFTGNYSPFTVLEDVQ